MNRLQKSLIFSSLILLLTFEALVCPVFPFVFNENPSGVAEFRVSQKVELAYAEPVFQKGMSYSCWSSHGFGSSASDESLRLLAETGTEWIALCFSWYQSNTTSHDIQSSSITPTTESLKHAISTAHSYGLKVMLKPMVEALEREETLFYPVWRGEIQPSDRWFESYSAFINFFAEFAEQNDVELFCVGCEYKATTGEREQWETVIQGVRERYSGPITYAADWTNYRNIEWWGSVDYVGIDAYFPLSVLKYNPTFDELKNAWVNYANEMEAWLSTVNKPVILTEIGYRSGDGTNMAPSNYWSDMAVDLQEQRDCYEAAFQALWNRGWFYGFYWWTWTYDPEQGGPNDSSHIPQGKPAQEVITQWYSRDRQFAVIDQTFVSAEKCGVNEVQSVGFHVKWEDDCADVVDGRVYVNGTEHVTNSSGWIGFSVAYEVVGERSWAVTGFQHPEANGYRVTVEGPSIVWDKLVVDVKVDSFSFGALKVRVNVAQAYDGASVTEATVAVNGEACKEIEPGVYETNVASWSPIQQVTVQTDATDLPSETWTTSTFHAMNAVLYLALFVAAIVTAILLLKRLRHSPSQTTE
ncbi:MAG TPA: hypothetical protein ENN36_01640 [Candidatus Bathyarchaeota archaeon]|nr:hypothetical protein [Candidatus Bathyarchaeota archaeon]